MTDQPAPLPVTIGANHAKMAAQPALEATQDQLTAALATVEAMGARIQALEAEVSKLTEAAKPPLLTEPQPPDPLFDPEAEASPTPYPLVPPPAEPVVAEPEQPYGLRSAEDLVTSRHANGASGA